MTDRQLRLREAQGSWRARWHTHEYGIWARKCVELVVLCVIFVWPHADVQFHVTAAPATSGSALIPCRHSNRDQRKNLKVSRQRGEWREWAGLATSGLTSARQHGAAVDNQLSRARACGVRSRGGMNSHPSDRCHSHRNRGSMRPSR
jgi:hypothetical protein